MKGCQGMPKCTLGAAKGAVPLGKREKTLHSTATKWCFACVHGIQHFVMSMCGLFWDMRSVDCNCSLLPALHVIGANGALLGYL